MKSTELKQAFHTATHKTTTGRDGQPKESLRVRLFTGAFSVLAIGGGLFWLHGIDEANKAGIHDSLNAESGRKILHSDIVNPDQKLDTSFGTKVHRVSVNRIGQGPCTAVFELYRAGEHKAVLEKVLGSVVPNRAIITDAGDCEPVGQVEQREHASVPPNIFPVPTAQPSLR